MLSLETRSPETGDGLLPEICIPSRKSLGKRTNLYTDIRTGSKEGIKLWACGRGGREIILPESYWSDSCLLKETTPSPSHQLVGTRCYGLGSGEPSPPLGLPQTFWGPGLFRHFRYLELAHVKLKHPHFWLSGAITKVVSLLTRLKIDSNSHPCSKQNCCELSLMQRLHFSFSIVIPFPPCY